MKLVGHGMGVLDLCFDDRYIVSCSKVRAEKFRAFPQRDRPNRVFCTQDTKTHVWDRSTGKLHRVLQGHRGPVNAVQIHGDRVLTASGDSLMKMWDLHTGQALRTFTGHSRGLACVSWAPSGKWFVSSSNDKTIKLWDAETGEMIHKFNSHSSLVFDVSFSASKIVRCVWPSLLSFVAALSSDSAPDADMVEIPLDEVWPNR